MSSIKFMNCQPVFCYNFDAVGAHAQGTCMRNSNEIQIQIQTFIHFKSSEGPGEIKVCKSSLTVSFWQLSFRSYVSVWRGLRACCACADAQSERRKRVRLAQPFLHPSGKEENAVYEPCALAFLPKFINRRRRCTPAAHASGAEDGGTQRPLLQR